MDRKTMEIHCVAPCRRGAVDGAHPAAASANNRSSARWQARVEAGVDVPLSPPMFVLLMLDPCERVESTSTPCPPMSKSMPVPPPLPAPDPASVSASARAHDAVGVAPALSSSRRQRATKRSSADRSCKPARMCKSTRSRAASFCTAGSSLTFVSRHSSSRPCTLPLTRSLFDARRARASVLACNFRLLLPQLPPPVEPVLQ